MEAALAVGSAVSGAASAVGTGLSTLGSAVGLTGWQGAATAVSALS
jgi:hypothetical protein